MILNASDRSGGLPLVLLHAFPLHGGMWEEQQRALPPRFRTIAVDLPGFGNSPPARHLTMESCAGDVIETLDGLRIERAAFCGISMGGYVAFEIWRKYPERAAALILADTRAQADSPEARETRRRQIALINAGNAGKKNEVVASLTFRLTSERTKRTLPRVAAAAANMAAQASSAALAAMLEALANRRDSTALLPAISVPALIVVGENDTIAPPERARAMCDAIPGAEFAVIPDAGHLPPLESPAAFNAAVAQFLKNLAGTSGAG